MKLGFIGLGRMGKNMVLNLAEKGHRVIVHNRSPGPMKEVEAKGAIPTQNFKELTAQLDSPKIVWLMVTSSAIDEMLKKLVPYLQQGDIVIDGGNSYFEDSIKRAISLEKKGIHFLDCGTSGGIDGARHGACLMIGGNKEVFKKAELVFKELAAKDSYAHIGQSGAGHFVKMMHNGIEYGMMGALAEGLELIHKKQPEFNIDMHAVTKVYANGSIVEGKLTKLLEKGLKRGDFEAIVGSVPKGETEDEMLKLERLGNLKILRQSRLMRKKTRKNPSYAGKIIALLRNEFGGHAVNVDK